MLFYTLVALSLTTDLLEGFLPVGDFYLSPIRLYIPFMAYCIMVMLMMKNILPTPAVGPIFRRFIIISMIFVSIVTLSVINSPDVWYSVKRTLNLISLVALSYLSYFLAKLEKVNERNVMKVWLVIGIVLCFLGGMQYLFNVSFGAKALEYSHRDIIFFEVKRISSLFNDPNFFGYYLVSFLFLSVYYPYTKKNYFYKPYLIALAVLFILFTGSRGTIIAILGSYLIMKIHWDIKLKHLLAAIIIILIAVLLSHNILINLFNDRILPSLLSMDVDENSMLSRYLIWLSGLQLVVDHPLMGVGPGNFVFSEKADFLDWLPAGRQEVLSGMAGHSNYLEVGAESGIPALAVYIIMLIYILIVLKRSMNSSDKVLSSSQKWIFATIVGMMIANLFLSYFAFFTFVLMGYALYLGERSMVAERSMVNVAEG